MAILEFEDELRWAWNDCPSLLYRHIIYELYYDQKLLLKQYYFFVLSLIINQHCPLYLERNELNKIYLLKFLCLIEEENILHNFEKIEKNSSFQWNSSYYLQASYFGLCQSRVLAMLSWPVMLKKNQHSVKSWHSLQTRNVWTPNLKLTLLHPRKFNKLFFCFDWTCSKSRWS